MKNKTQTQTAWVIRNRKTGRYVNRLAKSDFAMKLENALTYATRQGAREDRYTDETVQKVLLNKKNRAIKVIGGNGPNCRF